MIYSYYAVPRVPVFYHPSKRYGTVDDFTHNIPQWAVEKGAAAVLSLIALSTLLYKTGRSLFGKFLLRPLVLYVFKKYPKDITEAITDLAKDTDNRKRLEEVFELPSMKVAISSLQEAQMKSFDLIDQLGKRFENMTNTLAELKPVIVATSENVKALHVTQEHENKELTQSVSDLRAEVSEVRGTMSVSQRMLQAIMQKTNSSK